MPWTFYAAFIGTLGSIIGHGSIAITQHERQNPRNFSELAAAEAHILLRFRWIALSCSTLLGITVYWFITPRNDFGIPQSITWSLEYVGGIAMLILPAKGKVERIHNACAQAMAVSMLCLAYLFVPALNGAYLATALACAGTMTLLGLATWFDRRHFLIYELTFIFLSHISICIADAGLR